ncbi:MAG: hypothetical protein RDV48_12445 [Candidatus Eremiobacteraeota bacterium]|nr:hypothetical protein [Candidatus Eremiobacteraeota bacterium]
MKCIKCGEDNPPSLLRCDWCKALLPQTEDLSMSEAMGEVFITDEQAGGTKKETTSFRPLEIVEEAVEQLREGSITIEDFDKRLEGALAPLQGLVSKVQALPHDARGFASKGFVMIEEGYGKFADAVVTLMTGFEEHDEKTVQKGIEGVQEATAIFRKAYYVGNDELSESEPQPAEGQ